jgi:hypothetical protein
VQLNTTICASSSAVGSTCTDLGNSGGNALNDTGQAMLGYRIPVAGVEPATFTSVDTTVIMNENASYAAELQRLLPAPPGQKWVGYVSQPQTFNAAGVTTTQFQPEFKLGQGADGSPFQGPFNFRAVTGIRAVSITALATRPVVCGATAFVASADLTTFCVDSPTPATIATDIPRATKDLGILTGAAATASAGQTAQLTFQLKFAGTVNVNADFTLSATTTLAGAGATANAVTFIPPTDSTSPVVVSVPVPAGAAPGTYDVTLNAALANGQTRTGIGKLTVPAPPPAVIPPVITPPAVTPPATTPTVVKLKVSFALPKGLVAAIVTRKGIVLVFKTNKKVLATIKLFQGKSKKALLSKRVTLRSPSTKVTLKSSKLKKGAIKITVTGTGLSLTRAGTLK